MGRRLVAGTHPHECHCRLFCRDPFHLPPKNEFDIGSRGKGVCVFVYVTVCVEFVCVLFESCVICPLCSSQRLTYLKVTFIDLCSISVLSIGN